MKPLIHKIALVLILTGFAGARECFSQAVAKGRLNVSVSYFAVNDKLPFVVAKAKTKIDGRFKPVGGVALQLYLTDDSAGHLIAEVVTGGNGEASASIPPGLQQAWARSTKRTFLVRFPGDTRFGPAEGDLTVTRAKIRIDTAAGKKILATVLEWKDTGWAPVKGVDVVIAIQRLNSWLNVNQTASFSTDSTGAAMAEFKRDSIPGDANGNIVLVAKVDDNDSYGNLLQEMTVPWGAKFVGENDFGQRALFATRNRAPLWLLLMAYSIVFSVWGVLAYLVINLVRIRNSGKTSRGGGAVFEAGATA